MSMLALTDGTTHPAHWLIMLPFTDGAEAAEGQESEESVAADLPSTPTLNDKGLSRFDLEHILPKNPIVNLNGIQNGLKPLFIVHPIEGRSLSCRFFPFDLVLYLIILLFVIIWLFFSYLVVFSEHILPNNPIVILCSTQNGLKPCSLYTQLKMGCFIYIFCQTHDDQQIVNF